MFSLIDLELDTAFKVKQALLIVFALPNEYFLVFVILSAEGGAKNAVTHSLSKLLFYFKILSFSYYSLANIYFKIGIVEGSAESMSSIIFSSLLCSATLAPAEFLNNSLKTFPSI